MAKKRGRPKKAQTIETEWMVKLPALERRCHQLGWRPTVHTGMSDLEGRPVLTFTIEQLKQADKFGGTVWGMAYLGGKITRLQFEAADEFAVLRRSSLFAQGAPSETPQGGSVMAVDCRGHGSTSGDYGQHAVDTYNAMVGFMGGLWEHNVIRFCIGEPCSLSHVRTGLDRAAEFFQIEVAA